MTTLLIDTCNLYYSCKVSKRGAIKYETFLSVIRETFGVAEKKIAFVNAFGKNSARFVRRLEDFGVETRSKLPKNMTNGVHVTNWNVELTLEILAAKDEIILCSNDSDLVPAIEMAFAPVHVFACGIPKAFHSIAFTKEIPQGVFHATSTPTK